VIDGKAISQFSGMTPAFLVHSPFLSRLVRKAGVKNLSFRTHEE